MTGRSSIVPRIDQSIAIFATTLHGAVYGFLFSMAWPLLIVMLVLHAIQICVRSWRYFRAKRDGDTMRPEPFRIMFNNRVLSVRAEWMWLLIGFGTTILGIEVARGLI